MNHRYAVIDLGTNTFHLLIIEKLSNGNLEEIFRERVFVKLASEGIQNIGAAPFKRGLETMLRFHSLIQKHQVSSIKAKVPQRCVPPIMESILFNESY